MTTTTDNDMDARKARLANADKANWLKLRPASRASTTPLSASSGPHTASSFMAPPPRSPDGAGPSGLTPAPTGTSEPIGRSRPPRPSRTLGGNSSGSSGASGRPALPPTMGGPTEAGQGGPCSLLGQVFYRQKWRDFGPATPEARKNLAPLAPLFRRVGPGWRCNWVQPKTHPRPSGARRPRTPTATLRI